MNHSVWAQGGQGVSIRWAVVNTTLGQMLVAVIGQGVCRLSLDEGHEALAR